MANQYSVSVDTPCPGTQVVNKLTSTAYRGMTGDFTKVTLMLPTGSSTWIVTVYDLSANPGPCGPSRAFHQADPDAADPLGEYWLNGPSGPDAALGVAQVNPYP